MCMSPDEMSSARIEEVIAEMEGWIENGDDRKFWSWRIEEFQKLLKERAENGTYATAGI